MSNQSYKSDLCIKDASESAAVYSPFLMYILLLFVLAGI